MMNKRATVVHIAGDQDMANAILSGFAESKTRAQLARTQAQLKQAEAERDLMRIGYTRCLREKSADAALTYRFSRPSTVKRIILIVWTWLHLLLNTLTREDM